MSSELDSTGHGDQAWSPTPEEFEKLTRWAGEISTRDVRGPFLWDLYDKEKEQWLHKFLREPKDLRKLGPFLNQRFLLALIYAEPLNEPEDAHSSSFIRLMQQYGKSPPIEKALINFVLERVANVTMAKLVRQACEYLYLNNRDLNIQSWPPPQLRPDMRDLPFKWLHKFLREPKDLRKLAPFIKQRFLLALISTEPIEPEDACSFPLIGLLQHYVRAEPIEKVLINFVLKLVANVTMAELVREAITHLAFENQEDLNIRSWLPPQVGTDVRDVPWKTDRLSNLSNTARACVKRLRGDHGAWEWDRQWELMLRTREQDYCGHVCIVPFRDDEWDQFDDPPEPWHREWGIQFLAKLSDTLDQIPDYVFLVKGSLPEVKAQVDTLLATNTPEIPNVPAWDA